ncbi:phosphoribosylformylglycinamidine cyclo-ligase, chloroplastic-like [Rosa rugosa]|uniref:phosphoribosylformylglycinamidine cyclo-ligase, chloroplastic-like n=1 Tax=Rosa rugosa TaxID=74645 RepID=UPI002B40DC89|nr:phosphoribosylformylglycinamidine cyclo-ligase, chloroplastic-like [Rosa rugosa]
MMLCAIFLTVFPLGFVNQLLSESRWSHHIREGRMSQVAVLKHPQNYLKVLNHIRGLEEQHASNISLFLEPSHYFFLDYFATSCLDVYLAEKVIKGIVDGCQQSDCALLGGETAEMPGFYAEGEYDLNGFVVGIVKKELVIDGKNILAGDVLIGLPSSGVHSNGFLL